jgi:hypothetical protein
MFCTCLRTRLFALYENVKSLLLVLNKYISTRLRTKLMNVLWLRM